MPQMESGVSRVADTTIYVAHLFAASVWIGGLVLTLGALLAILPERHKSA